MSKERSFGKIRYIEPNDIIENTYSDGNHNGSFNIPHPYEDYSISVDLVVDVPSRYGYAKNEKISIEISDEHSNRVSFFNGTDGYFTDNVTSITYKDILTDKDTKESLGITNIHITYNSYFYPEVTINFSDIRGASLMMPHEENYMREIRNEYQLKESEKSGKEYNPIYTKKVKNFFTSLFNFPYPEFKLRVKGFYGKKVEYSLLVSDFRSSFNNSTGNFDIIVKFIGKMYGVYTDIPMSYLLLAPYCKYGCYDNTTIWQKNNFRFDNGVSIPTFLDLKKKILTITHELPSSTNQEINDKYKKIDNRLNLLQKINNEYTKIANILSENSNVFAKDNVFLCKIVDGGCDYLYAKNSGELLNNTQTLFELIQKYNKETETSTLPYLSPLTKVGSRIGYSNKVKVEKYGNGIKIYLDALEFDKIKKCPNLSRIIYNYLETNQKTIEYFYMLNALDFNEILYKEINEVNKTKNELIKESSQSTNFVISEILGFKPTIKNIVHIVMAHLQVFMELFKTCIDNVTDLNTRNLNDLGLSIKSVCDVKPDKPLPPFPAIKDVNKNEFCYPSPYYINGFMEETILIDSLLNSVKDVNKLLGSLNKLDQEYKSDDIILIPTCVTDFLNNHNNPYETVLDSDDNFNGIDWIFTYFGLRCVSKIMYERLGQMTPEEFGKCEAYNFWRVNMDLRRDIIDKLKNNECNSINFIKFLLKERNIYIDDKGPCYLNSVIQNGILSTDIKGNLVPSILNSFPAIIGRDGGSIDTFISDIINDTDFSHSFKYGQITKQRPYKYIDLIEEDVLTEWNNKFNYLESSDYITDERKKIIIENYITSNKDLFFEEKNTITYKKEEYNYFLRSYKANNIDESKLFVTLNEAQKEDFNCELDSIRIKKVPLFFSHNIIKDNGFLPSYYFLMSIPHNITKLANSFKTGKCVTTIPESTLLFLGMIIYLLKNKKEFITSTFVTDMNEMYGVDKNYFYDLRVVISCLMRSETFEYNEDACSYKPVAIHTGYDIMKSFYDFNELKNYYHYDCLNLSEKYVTWVSDNSEGGFLYFKKAYCLIENTTSDDVYYIKQNGNTLEYEDGKTSISFSGDNIENRLFSLCNNFYGNVSNVEKDSVLILNRVYKTVYNDFSTNTPFTDRYSRVLLTKNNVYLSLNSNFSAYKHLSQFLKNTKKLVIPYRMEKYPESETFNDRPIVDRSVFSKSFDSFKKKLIELYEGKSKINEKYDNTNIETTSVSEENKFAMYRTLKNLYDKHLSNLKHNITNFMINKNGKDNEFNRFHFVNSYFNDISDDLMFNLDEIVNLITTITNGYESGKGDGYVSSEMSVYSFIASLCEKHNLMFMCLPIFNGSFKNYKENTLKEMFTPKPYNKSFNEDALRGPCYICFYPNQPSQHLDIPDSEYTNDGFNIANDMNETGSFNGPLGLGEMSETDDYTIPAFGVEYGSQKQSIFTNINVNMDSPQITEVAVANMFDLANNNNKDRRGISFTGQDLYKIYSNYSYTCQVEMMGCSQIQPLMYFQLNNIPLFRGAYQIINVEHNITPGNMTTSFKGVRLNKTKMPMVSNCISSIVMKKILNNNNNNSISSNTLSPMNIENITRTESMVNTFDTGITITSEYLKTEYNEHIKFENGQEEAFNDLNPSLRNLIYCIVSDLKKMSKKLQYNLGIFITSSTRISKINGNETSDHLVGYSPSERRKELYVEDTNGTRIYFSQMGCAVDMVGTNNGKIDHGEASINVFRLIATNYYDYIRQLIWEVKGCSTSQNHISQIHLASYGKVGAMGSDKNELYLASYDNKYSGRLTGCEKGTLPSEFIKILKDLCIEKCFENGLYVSNFPNGKPTIDKLEELYDYAIKTS